MVQRMRATGTQGGVPSYELFIGIDYSGAQTPEARPKALQVYVARPGALPTKELSPTASNNGRPLNWSRKEIAGSLIELARSGVPYLAGIDHGFSFPVAYFERYRLGSWPAFLVDFAAHWPTDEDHTYVDIIRFGALPRVPGRPEPGGRVGTSAELRLCERWTRDLASLHGVLMAVKPKCSVRAGRNRVFNPETREGTLYKYPLPPRS